MASKNPLSATLVDLLYQALETEQGGIRVYETAIRCALNDDLRKEWEGYLDETRNHERILRGVLQQLGLDPEARPPSRDVVAGIAAQLVAAMQQALAKGTPEQAELVACEAVVNAETKDHSNWELLSHVATHDEGPHVPVIKAAVDEVEDQEDHHLYHTKGWCRELWLQALGFPAALPPPEEVRQVETALGAARAEQQREDFL